MEVHVNGLPPFLSHDALQKRLEPIMATLGIGPTDFTTDKPKKSKWAHVAFLNPSHGASFLRKYGEQWVPAKNSGRASANGPVKNNVRKARLQLMGNDIYCTASKRASPEPITLRALQYATEEQRNPTRKVETDGAPERFRLRAISCGLNSFHGESDQLMFTPQVEYRNITNAVAKFSKRLLLIKWQQAGEGLILATQKIMRIPMDTVLSLVYSRPDRLNLTLIEEPSFCEEQCDLPSLLSSLGFNDRSRAEPKRNRVCHLDQKHAKVVGHCLVYQLELSEPQNLTALEHHPVTPLVRYDLAPGPIHAESSDVSMRALKDQLIDYTRTAELPFDIMYQLQSLAWNAYLEPRTVSALAKKLKNVYKRDKISISGTQRVTAQALQRLRKELDWPLPFGDPSVFRVESILTYLMEKQKEIRQETATGRKSKPPTRQALVYRITVTPTRITLHGPELEAKNRILRKFEDRHEFFARVQFCDENGQNLFFNGKIDHSKIFERYKRVLDQGIQVAGRVYSFLGFSNSSLRSHSCWFSAPFVDRDGKHQSYNVILRELGDFSSIRSPARLAARIGQAFSETPYSVSLVERDIVKTIPDVESSGKSRVFSDGVGTISQEIVHRIWDVLPITKAAPTAFQIRLQGAKGMLALDSRLPASLPLVRLRPSMIKFPSQERKVLEICDTASKPIPLYLNRQMIKILEDMGVKDAWFFKMQGIMLSQLRAVTDSTYNVARFLKQQNVGEALRLHRLFRQLENMGIDYRKDPFLTSVVEASLLRELRLLKHKARIRIGDGGVTLFGIMDETGYLKEGEVHVSYDMMNSRFSPPPEEGAKLVVTRSPALHPGDIQLAVQKIPPEGHPLRQHHNVIVFSQHGERDLPSQLSGGDLDGDIYNVIWDVEAMPLRVFEPADYPRVAPLELGRKVRALSLSWLHMTNQSFCALGREGRHLEFFHRVHEAGSPRYSFYPSPSLRFDDNPRLPLGVIATRHMILADQRELGTLDQDCLKLAELHSLAADYPKSGRAASLASLPRAPRYRPDL